MILRVLRGVRRRLLGGPPPGDYRAYLFEERVAYLDGRRPKRILEIGPKDGADTQRLLRLDPEPLTSKGSRRLTAARYMTFAETYSIRDEPIRSSHTRFAVSSRGRSRSAGRDVEWGTKG